MKDSTIEREKLERMMMLLAVATFHTPALQAERTELVEAGLKALAAQPAVPLTDEQKRDLIKKSALWDMHIHIGWYSAPAKSFVEKTIQLIADIEAAHGITKGQP